MDLACIIYVDYTHQTVTLDAVLQAIIATSDNADLATYVANNDIDIVRNKPYPPRQKKIVPCGFPCYRYRVELFPNDDICLQEQVTLVSVILQALWKREIPAVAACDYEDDLPHDGGYKNGELTFPR